ncbi:hypothetical protein JB92DRAFT_2828992 [Gautieria morchelliformis]|nr:hypothetical protein JB92DRAFT_2828992 [Gautieria morchelliformis]
MINNLAIRMFTLVVGLSALPSVLSVCERYKEIGLGNAYAGSAGEHSLIFSNDCDIIDQRKLLSGNICANDYIHRASVQCIAGTQTPNTVQTGDGNNWGNCRSVTQSCGNGQVVHYCCARN